jgi:hypothetical protein
LFDKPHRSTPKNNHPGVTTTLKRNSQLTPLLLSWVSGESSGKKLRDRSF